MGDKCTFIVLHKETFNETGSEVETMVAEKGHRGQGLGWESMLLMLRFGVKKLGIQIFEAKIKMSNNASIKMFQKIGFKEISRSDVFEEITLSLHVNDEFCQWLQNSCSWEIKSYNH